MLFRTTILIAAWLSVGCLPYWIGLSEHPYCDAWDGRTDCYSVLDERGRGVSGVIFSCRSLGASAEAVSDTTHVSRPS